MIKELSLSNGRITILNDYDYDRIIDMGLTWRADKDKNTYYVRANYRGSNILMHRIILNVPPEMLTDHIDGNGLNNTRRNLRIVTYAQNGMNKQIPIDNTSGYKGVYFEPERDKYHAQIRVNYKGIFLGRFDDPKEAAKAYNKAAEEHFGEFARLNVV